VLTQRTDFAYNLQGRLAQVTLETLNAAGMLTRREVISYGYDDSGIRVSALHEVDANGEGTFETRTRTEYLNDPHNHTGTSSRRPPLSSVAGSPARR
jgi:hypothetical protein